jgi:hypothetical protein
VEELKQRNNEVTCSSESVSPDVARLSDNINPRSAENAPTNPFLPNDFTGNHANDSCHNGQDINNVSASPTLDQSCACVKSCSGVSIDLVFPTFENLPGQNARAHLESLIDYLKLKNVPSQLHLFTAMKSLKGSTVTT